MVRVEMRKLKYISVFLLVLLAGCRPVASIDSPEDGDTFEAFKAIAFAGSAYDFEGGQLTGTSLVWTSDRYGEIGQGERFITYFLFNRLLNSKSAVLFHPFFHIFLFFSWR